MTGVTVKSGADLAVQSFSLAGFLKSAPDLVVLLSSFDGFFKSAPEFAPPLGVSSYGSQKPVTSPTYETVVTVVKVVTVKTVVMVGTKFALPLF